MKAYSLFRLNDIYKEHSHQYLGLEKLIETFSNCPARYTTEDLIKQISTRYTNIVGAKNIPDLDGYPYKYPNQLAQFLYKVGFFVGRKEHEGKYINAEFVRYEQRPELLTDMRNLDDGLLWEIHPSYETCARAGVLRFDERRPGRACARWCSLGYKAGCSE